MLSYCRKKNSFTFWLIFGSITKRFRRRRRRRKERSSFTLPNIWQPLCTIGFALSIILFSVSRNCCRYVECYSHTPKNSVSFFLFRSIFASWMYSIISSSCYFVCFFHSFFHLNSLRYITNGVWFYCEHQILNYIHNFYIHVFYYIAKMKPTNKQKLLRNLLQFAFVEPILVLSFINIAVLPIQYVKYHFKTWTNHIQIYSCAYFTARIIHPLKYYIHLNYCKF